MNTKLLINGKLVAGKGAAEQVIDPASGKTLATVHEASKAQIDAAVEAAQAAFDGWAATPPRDRAALLLKLADRIEADAADYAALESANCGKPLAAVGGDEIPAVADVMRFFAGAARTMHGAVAGEYLAGYTSMIRRDPVGVVASIAPWNYPLMMAAWKLAPALAAGNTVVLKPSEQTPLSTLRLATTLAELFPPGRGEHHLRARRERRGAADLAPDGGDDFADRGRLDRREGARRRGQGRQAHAPGTRRQGSGDRVRRRRRGIGGQRRAHLRLLQRRPGLHRRLPHLCRRQGVRAAWWPIWPPPSARSRWAPSRWPASKWGR